MYLYRCHFLDHGNNIRSVDYFRESDDQRAIRRALGLNVGGIGAGFELWQEERQVYSHSNHPK